MSKHDRGSFFSELKRRNVGKVTIVYAWIAFAIWQAADIAFPALGIPDWAMTLVVVGALVSLPFVVVAAWLFEVTPEGVRRTDELDAVVPERVSAGTAVGGAGQKRLATAVAVSVLLLAGAWFGVGRAIIPSEVQLVESSLAVFPFSVNGPEDLAYMREGLVTLLARNLSGFSDFHAVDPSAVVRAAEQVADGLDVEEGGRIARRVGAGKFILGSVSAGGSEVRIHAELYALKDSIDALASGEVTGHPDDLLSLVDALTAKLLANQETGAASMRLVRNAALMTSSLEALRAYLEGEQNFRKGEMKDAIAGFQRALAVDSLFTVARYRLAVAYEFEHQHNLASRETDRVVEEADRLSYHDRLVLEAYQDYLNGRIDEAERRFRRVIAEFPTDLEAKFLLSRLLMEFAQMRGDDTAESARLLEAILEADPGFTCVYCALLGALEGGGDADKFRARWRAMKRANEAEDTVLTPRDELAVALRVERDADGVHELLATARAEFDTTGADPEDVGHNLFHLAQGLLSVGMLPEKVALMEESRALAPDLGERASNPYRLALATGRWRDATRLYPVYMEERDYPLPEEVGRALGQAPLDFAPAFLEGFRERLLDWTEGRAWSYETDEGWPEAVAPASRLYLLGLVDSRRGRLGAARAWADSLTALSPSDATQARVFGDMAVGIRADVAYREGDHARVLQLTGALRPDVPPAWIYPSNHPHYHARTLQAASALARGDHATALRILDNSLRDEMVGGQRYGTWSRDRARALDGLGRTDEAVEYYRRFLEAWNDADPELQPQVAEARTRLAELEGSGV